MLTFDEDKQNKRVEELHLKEAEDLADVLSQKYGLPYIDLSKVSINTDALRMVNEEESRAGGLAVFKIIGRTIHVAILTPNNSKTQELLADLKQKTYDVVTYMTSTASLERAWERYAEISLSKKAEAGVIQISDEEINGFVATFKNLDDIKSRIVSETELKKENKEVSGILEIILSGAYITKASDIHLEPQEEAVRIRYRLDGVLQDIADVPSKFYKQILSRIKLVSGLKLNVKLGSQDGRFSIKIEGLEIEIRTSVIPTAYGESIVMRLLNPKSIEVTFETLGVDDDLFKIFEREIKKPNGMVLLTGPTGSGKTTTLYSFLRKVNSPETKIITIEDPIEYHLEGVNQTQVNRKADYTFLSGLRAALRQDPDIIMVGEIRDSETAKIAINASLTGHLVFSTLHTNNAAGAIPRLIDLGVNPKIITSALTLPIAQRLTRILCSACKKEDAPTAEEKVIIDKTIETIKKKRPQMVLPATDKIYRAVGCSKCNNTGYKGRVGIFEAIAMDQAIAKVTIENPSEREIKIAAIPQGILDMRQDGILKVLHGTTSMEDLSRVIDLNEEFI